MHIDYNKKNYIKITSRYSAIFDSKSRLYLFSFCLRDAKAYEKGEIKQQRKVQVKDLAMHQIRVIF